jgi:proteasome assembly chaperone 4
MCAFLLKLMQLVQDRTPSVAALLGGGANSTGASMARRLSMRTGWSIVLASSLPSNSPTIEAFAEQRLFQELKTLGYVKPISKSSNRAPPTLATKLQA